MSKELKELLKYSTSLSSSGTVPTTTSKLDASILDQLMGPDDAKLMLSSMSAIEDDLPLEQIEIAFENLEALVEQIDNAKNLRNLNLWTPLLKQLGKDEDVYRRGACAVIATAVQNNPDSQRDFLQADGLAKVLRIFENDSSVDVRRKALFAITSSIRNNEAGLREFDKLHGWKVFSDFFDGQNDTQMLKRIIFFLRTIYIDGDVRQDVKTGFPPKLVELLGRSSVQDDEDLSEKILQTVLASLEYDTDVLNADLKERLKATAHTLEARYGDEMCDFPKLYAM